MRWAHSLRGRLTLAMLLVFILGMLVSAAFSTREARQEAVLSTTEMLREARMDQQDARGALIGIFLDEAIDWLLGFVPLAMASFALVWLIGWWSLRPLARASRQAAAIGPATPSGRVPTGALPREIRPLVDAVNGALERLDHAYAAQRRLSERLDHAYAAQRRLTADAAHELRTPLTVLSLRLQQAKLDATVNWPAVERDLAVVAMEIVHPGPNWEAVVATPPAASPGPRMDIHQNARTTLHGRCLMIRRLADGWTVAEVAAAFGVTLKTVRKWRDRHARDGEPGLVDRSSRPRYSPTRLSDAVADEIEQLRRQRLSAPAIARKLGRPVSTVGLVLRRRGLGRLAALDPRLEPIRYQRDRPGELIHLDVKKPGTSTPPRPPSRPSPPP